jgi:hypothetical protein
MMGNLVLLLEIPSELIAATQRPSAPAMEENMKTSLIKTASLSTKTLFCWQAEEEARVMCDNISRTDFRSLTYTYSF